LGFGVGLIDGDPGYFFTKNSGMTREWKFRDDDERIEITGLTRSGSATLVWDDGVGEKLVWDCRG